jgi:hypothetical protein
MIAQKRKERKKKSRFFLVDFKYWILNICKYWILKKKDNCTVGPCGMP